MRPLTFINGVLFASTTALSGVIGIIIFMRWVMSLDAGLDQSVIQGSLPLGELCRDMAIFGVLAVIAGVAFWAEIRLLRWRGGAEALLLCGVVAVLIFFLADSANQLRDLGILGCVVLGCGLLWQLARSTGFARWLRAWLDEQE